MKKQTEIITNNWWDLKQTAKDLDVPVSTIVFVKEWLHTDNREKVIDYIALTIKFRKENVQLADNIAKHRPLTPDECTKVNSFKLDMTKAVTNGNPAGETYKEATDKTAETLKIALERTIEPIIVTIKTGWWIFKKEYKLQVSLDGDIKVQELYLNPLTGNKEWNKANEVTTITLKALQENLKQRKRIIGY